MWAEPSLTDKEVLTMAVDDVQLADELGFDSMMFGEHHFHKTDGYYGRIPVPELLIANLSAQTDHIRLGTGVKVLALDPPWRTAESMLLLDLLTDGRAFWGLGQGTVPATFPPGTTDDKRRLMYREHLVEVVEILRSGGSLPEPINPVALRDVTERIWVAARDEESIRLAADLDLNFVVGQAEHAGPQAELVAEYRQAGGTREARGTRAVFVGETDEEAFAEIGPAVEMYSSKMAKGKYTQDAIARGFLPEGDPTNLQEAMDLVSILCGSPATVLSKLKAYKAQLGVDRVDVMFHLPGLSADALQRSMRLFATEVLPNLETTAAAETVR